MASTGTGSGNRKSCCTPGPASPTCWARSAPRSRSPSRRRRVREVSHRLRNRPFLEPPGPRWSGSGGGGPPSVSSCGILADRFVRPLHSAALIPGTRMDPICHTLVGLCLADSGLKRRTALGTATLVIAANLPDVDVLALFLGQNL